MVRDTKGKETSVASSLCVDGLLSSLRQSRTLADSGQASPQRGRDLERKSVSERNRRSAVAPSAALSPPGPRTRRLWRARRPLQRTGREAAGGRERRPSRARRSLRSSSTREEERHTKSGWPGAPNNSRQLRAAGTNRSVTTTTASVSSKLYAKLSIQQRKPTRRQAQHSGIF